MLGQVYGGLGEHEKAVPLLLRALEIQKNSPIPNGDNIMMLRESAECSLTKLGRKEEAKEIDLKYRSSTEWGPNVPKDNTIIGGVVNGKALSLPKPSYPVEAHASRASGSVNVKVLIDGTGKVIFACAVSGASALHLASESAAYQAKFSPTTLSGKPVKVSGVITYNFVL